MLFPKVFTYEQPWKADPDFSRNPLPATIPIYRLSHTTHTQEALNICSTGNFTFVPNQKLGKSHPAGVTYKYKGESKYEVISSSYRVFPGYLSWWGIDVREWYGNDCELLESIVEERQYRMQYVPGYLAEKTESPYGDQALSIRLSQILQDYSKARQG